MENYQHNLSILCFIYVKEQKTIENDTLSGKLPAHKVPLLLSPLHRKWYQFQKKHWVVIYNELWWGVDVKILCNMVYKEEWIWEYSRIWFINIKRHNSNLDLSHFNKIEFMLFPYAFSLSNSLFLCLSSFVLIS